MLNNSYSMEPQFYPLPQFYPSTTISPSYHNITLLPLWQFHPPTVILSGLNYYLIPFFHPHTTILSFYHVFTLLPQFILLPQWYENVANLSVLAIQTNTLQLVEQDVCPVQAVCCVVNRHCSDMPHIVSHKFYPPPAIEICSPNHTGLTSIRPVEMSVIQSQLS